MAYTAIDGDISDFIDGMNLSEEYRTEELRAYLLAEGHSEKDAVAGIQAWQVSRFHQIGWNWESFTLTLAGRAVLEELRSRRG